eukprot:530543-Prorocentrum_minimum.AAC.5
MHWSLTASYGAIWPTHLLGSQICDHFHSLQAVCVRNPPTEYNCPATRQPFGANGCNLHIVASPNFARSGDGALDTLQPRGDILIHRRGVRVRQLCRVR